MYTHEFIAAVSAPLPTASILGAVGRSEAQVRAANSIPANRMVRKWDKKRLAGVRKAGRESEEVARCRPPPESRR